MWGFQANAEQMKTLAKHCWYDVNEEPTRRLLWDNHVDDPDIDYNNKEKWDDVYEALSYEMYWHEFDELIFCEMGLEAHRDEDHREEKGIMFIGGSFESVYSGETKELKIKNINPIWSDIIKEASEVLGVEIKPAWWIVGKWPGA